MSVVDQSACFTTPLLYQLAGNSDQFENAHDVVMILQQHFIRLFKSSGAETGMKKGTDYSLASREEERLLVVRAVHALHTVGAKRHGDFFRSESYHANAAFFIHEMLGSLSGDRRKWYRELQVESLRASVAVVEAVGCGNTRLCLPGIVSACTKYLIHAHHGRDATDVRVGAVNFLRASLVVSLAAQGDSERWFEETVGHLGCSMCRLLCPSELVGAEVSLPVIRAMLRLVVDVLALRPLIMFLSTPLVRGLLVGCFVLEGVVHFHGGDARVEMKCVPDVLFENESVMSTLCAQLSILQKIELLHYSSALLRYEPTRALVFSGETPFHRVMSQCIRVTGTEMGMEDLCGARCKSSRICAIVDGFIECVAYSTRSVAVGMSRLAAFMDECETTLADWESYALHPPIIYVLTRLVLWQFKVPVWAIDAPSPGVDDRIREKFSPENLILSGTFEHLWSVVAKPHLWNITVDEDLCTCRQLQHRHTTAATILRFLEITVRLLQGGCSAQSNRQKRALRRLNVLVLYLVLEKAVIAGIVHDIAMRVIQAFTEVSSHIDILSFFLECSDFIADEAARAVGEEELRVAATNVLRGGINLIRSFFTSLRIELSAPGATECRRWVQTVRERGKTSVVPRDAVSKVSDFVASSIKVANDGCRRSALQEDIAGTRAAVVLLTSCFELGALLNRSVTQLGFDEDCDTFTTASHPRVQILQITVLEAVQMLLAYCVRNDATSPYVVRAVTCGLTVFLTTPKAAAGHHGDTASDGVQSSSEFVWEDDSLPVLSRSHLRTVYKAYLAFLAILTEPIAAVGPPSATKQRSTVERRALEAVGVTPGVLGALGGLEALFALSADFLSQRMVEEVLPIVVTWYERAVVPRIPTGTEEKLRLGVKKVS